MQVPGYRMNGPIGFGADGATWLARDDDGDAVAVRMLAQVPPERHRRRLDRLERLAGVEHPHLVRLREVISTGPAQAALVTEAVPGPTLATLRVGRGGLGVDEATGIGAQLASALVALHEAGIIHGDVSPANVVLSPGEGAVLVDLAGEPSREIGTGGFAAPEQDRGEVPTAAADVYALARLVAWLVPEHHQTHVRERLAPALAAEPHQRCTAQELHATLGSYPVAPVSVPDLRSLAGVSVREHAQRDVTRRRHDHRPRHRADTGSRRVVVAVLLAVVLAVGLVWMLPRTTTLPGADAEETVTPIGMSTTTQEAARPGEHIDRVEAAGDPVAAVRALTLARDEALNTADSRALTRLTIPGSPAAAQDSALADALNEGDVQVTGLATEVVRAEEITTPATGGAGAQEARDASSPWPGPADHEGAASASVRAVLHTREHRLTTPEGTATVRAERTCVVLDLRAGSDGWQVAQVGRC
ncbi:serine/threonine-protein kinase [Pseudactinotalea sp. Z1739]|uniref:serine/threonine-protein kinase n=1 Tax=Pseudactinotalea sp. Z1739 TaxID=3413028 RepID=UPI003C7CFBA2